MPFDTGFVGTRLVSCTNDLAPRTTSTCEVPIDCCSGDEPKSSGRARKVRHAPSGPTGEPLTPGGRGTALTRKQVSRRDRGATWYSPGAGAWTRAIGTT
jgi:hypothetical protein